PSFVRQVHLVRADFFDTQRGWRLTKVVGKMGNLLKIGALGMRRQVAHLHVFDHALAKRGHRELHCRVGEAACSPSMLAQTEPFRSAGTFSPSAGSARVLLRTFSRYGSLRAAFSPMLLIGGQRGERVGLHPSSIGDPSRTDPRQKLLVRPGRTVSPHT